MTQIEELEDMVERIAHKETRGSEDLDFRIWQALGRIPKDVERLSRRSYRRLGNEGESMIESFSDSTESAMYFGSKWCRVITMAKTGETDDWTVMTRTNDRYGFVSSFSHQYLSLAIVGSALRAKIVQLEMEDSKR